MFLYGNLKIGSLEFWHDLHEVKLYRSYNFIFLFISKDKLKKPERPTIKSGLKLRVEKSVDFRPIQYSVIYDFHASKVNALSTRAHQELRTAYFCTFGIFLEISFLSWLLKYGGSCLSVAEGEIVTADENGTDEDGWLAVRKNDQRGKVPKSYLQPHGIMNV